MQSLKWGLLLFIGLGFGAKADVFGDKQSVPNPAVEARKKSYVRNVEFTDAFNEKMNKYSAGFNPKLHCLQLFKNFDGISPPSWNYAWAYWVEISASGACPKQGPAEKKTVLHSFYVGASSSLIEGWGPGRVGAFDTTIDFEGYAAKIDSLCFNPWHINSCDMVIRNHKICEIVPKGSLPTRPECK